MDPLLSYFNANHEVSPELYVTMTTGRAEKIIQVQSQRDSSFSQVKGMIRRDRKTGCWDVRRCGM